MVSDQNALKPAFIPELDFLVAPQAQPDVRRGEVDILLAERGGFWARAKALGTDQFLIGVIMATLSKTTRLTLDYWGISVWPSWFSYVLTLALSGIVIDGAYYTICYGSSGQTIGKMIYGLRVVSDTGQPLSYSQAFKRWLGYFSSGLGLGMGYLRVALHKDRLAWHDMLAHTVVVRL